MRIFNTMTITYGIINVNYFEGRRTRKYNHLLSRFYTIQSVLCGKARGAAHNSSVSFHVIHMAVNHLNTNYEYDFLVDYSDQEVNPMDLECS